MRVAWPNSLFIVLLNLASLRELNVVLVRSSGKVGEVGVGYQE